MKKISLIVISATLAIIAGVAFYHFSDGKSPALNNAFSSNTALVEDSGILFSYPKTITYHKQLPSVPTSHYNVHTLTGVGKSNITILIPIQEAPGETAPLSERLKDYPKNYTGSLPQIEQIRINGREAERMMIESDAEPFYTGEIIQLDSNYPNTRIVLTYQHFTEDPSLDEAWRMILNGLDVR